MLTSLCVTSTSLIVSTGAVSCYPALMANLIWFANEKYLSCQHWATCGHEIKCLAIQKCKPGVLVHCLAQTCERPTIPTDT